LAIRKIVKTSDLVLEAQATIRRTPPRDPAKIDGNYLELFDSQTVYCDVFQSGDDVVMVGPPLLNLEERFTQNPYRVDGDVTGVLPRSVPLDRAHRVVLEGVGRADRVAVRYHDDYEAELPVRADLNDHLTDKTVLVAMQRNNELAWIREWVEFYVKVNGVDSVVLYDMMSSRYTAHDIVAALDDVVGLDVLIVVEWPYKYGAQPSEPGMPWDSDYGQYVAWEHCRRRFLMNCYAVTVSDVDELFLAEDGRSIFEHAAESPNGFVRFDQKFIESAVDENPTDGKEISYSRYWYVDPEARIGTPKYAAIMDYLSDSHQLMVHTIKGLPGTITDEIYGRQFKPIKLAWQRRSFDRRFPDYLASTKALVVDEPLKAVFDRLARSDSDQDDLQEG